MRSEANTTRQLLDHQEFLRALARRHASAAFPPEDIEQQTWLRAIQCPPAEGHPLRGWLSRTVRNLAINSARSESRRREREERVADALDDGFEASSHDLEKLGLALERLRPEHRSAVSMRYLDGLSVPEIAAAEGVPYETVRTRLRRALSELRAEMTDGRVTQRRRLAAWLPLGWTRSLRRGSSGLPVGASLALVVVLACVAGFLIFGPSDEPAPVEVARGVAIDAQAVEPPPPVGERVLLESGGPSLAFSVEPAPVVPAQRALVGRVVDAFGRGVGLAEVLIASGDDPTATHPVAFTGSDGSFELEGVAHDAWVGARKAGFGPSSLFPLDQPCLRTSAGSALLLELGRAPARLEARVVDALGAPIEGATVRVGVQATSRIRLRGDGAAYILPVVQTETASDGSFELLSPWPANAQLDIRHASSGHWSGLVEELAATVALTRSEISGHVRLADGRAASNVRVEVLAAEHPESNTESTVQSDARGAFRLVHPGSGTWDLRASALVDGQPHVAVARLGTPDEVQELWLAPGGGLRGRARAADGSVLADWWVALRPELEFGSHLGMWSRESEPRWARTGPEGTFAFAGVESLRCTLELHAQRDSEEAPWARRDGLEVGTGDIALVASRQALALCSAAGRIVAEDGEGLALGDVLLFDSSGARVGRTPLGEDGQFSFSGLFAGAYELALWPADGPPRALDELQLEDGQHLERELVLGNRGSLDVALEGPGGEAGLTDLSARLVPLGGSLQVVLGATQGIEGDNFRFEPGPRLVASSLSPGEYVLSVESSVGAGCLRFVVHPGPTTVGSLRLQRATRPSPLVLRLPEALDGPDARSARAACGDLWVRVHDARGALMFLEGHSSLGVLERERALRARFPEGAARVVTSMRGANGVEYEAELELERTPDGEPVVLDLQPIAWSRD